METESEIPELSIIDESNPRSIINLVPTKLKIAIRELYAKHPEYLEMNERELRFLLKPDERTETVRLCFWEEYHRAQLKGSRMEIRNFIDPVMAPVVFYKYWTKDLGKVAWMLTPIASHMMSLKASLDRGRDTVGKILRMDIFDKQGNIKPREATLFLKVYELVENRVLGSVVNKIAIDQRMQIADQRQSENTEKKVDQLRDKLLSESTTVDVLPIDTREKVRS